MNAIPNPNNENLTTDATPSPAEEHKESDVAVISQQELASQNSNPKKKKSNVKTITNVINISNANGVHIGTKNTIFIQKLRTNKNCEFQTEVKNEIPDEISKLMHRNDQVTSDIIDFVSMHVGENWKQACLNLQYSDGQIFQFVAQYMQLYGIKEVMKNILNDWKQNEPSECRVGVLVAALWNAQEKDVVRRLSEELSKN